jgi:hypothetical protein
MIDLLSGINLSTLVIEEHASAVPLRFIDIKDGKVEKLTRLPSMMYTLWGYICTFRHFPSQGQFVNHYMHGHGEQIKGFDTEAITARILRTYPSLTREIHFYFLMKESGLFSSISYNAYDDVEQGIDLSVELGGYLYHVACFVSTKRSLEFRKKKRLFRHTEKPNLLELALDLSTGRKIGDMVFFDEKHVNLLLSQLLSHAKEKYNIHPLDLFCG